MNLWSVVVSSLGHFWFFVTPWTAARQASLSFTLSQRLLKLMSIESMMPSNHLILCHLLLFPALSLAQHQDFFPVSGLFPSPAQRSGASASASALPVNIQCWFPLGLTRLISLLSKWLSRVYNQSKNRRMISWINDGLLCSHIFW